MPKTSRRLTVHPLTLREVEVVRVTDLTPAMRRISLGGEQLGAFTSANGFAQPAFTSLGFDDHIRLIFPYPGQSEPVLPIQTEKGVDLPRNPRPLAKVYTVRRWDHETGELDVDFVKHGIGVGTTWAYRAQPGDRIHFYGPNSSGSLDHDADWLLMAGDETAIPAIARLLEELSPDTRGKVFIEVARAEDRLSLQYPANVELTWVTREGSMDARTILRDAVRASKWWDGKVFAWLAGEHSAVRDLRRHLVEERGLANEDVEFSGYWRRGEVVALGTDSAMPDPEKSATPFEILHEQTELVRPIAIRTAVELGVPELISRGVTGLAELAEKTACDARALGKLLRYLQTTDLVRETEPGNFGLTMVGEVLTNDFVTDALHPAGVVGREMLGIFGLTEAIRTGKPSYASVTGHNFSEVRAEQDYEDRYLARLAKFQPALAASIASSVLLAGTKHLVIHSGGAGAQAREFVTVHPQLQVTICALPAQANWLRRDLPQSIRDDAQRARIRIVEQSVFEPSPSSDTVLISRAFKTLPDADAAYALRRAAENLQPGGRLLLIEETFDTKKLDEHDGEADLIGLTNHGAGLRTLAELEAVITAAGLALKTTHTVGWGTPVLELAPTVKTSTPSTLKEETP